MPTLTQKIVEGNEAGNAHINIQAFIVGNGLSTYEFNDNSLVYFAYNHGLIGDDVWMGLVNNCNGSFHNPPNAKCKALVQQAMAVVYQDGLNFYALYLPCYPGDANPADTRMQRSRDLLFRHARGVAGQPVLSTPMLGESVPCINSTAGTNYLNRDDVRRAIHVNPNLPKWSICSDILRYNSTVRPPLPPSLRSLSPDCRSHAHTRGPVRADRRHPPRVAVSARPRPARPHLQVHAPAVPPLLRRGSHDPHPSPCAAATRTWRATSSATSGPWTR